MYGNKPLSKSTILDRISEFDIFSHYVKGFRALNKKFKSDLREDKNPTCHIFYNGQSLRYKDFAETGTLSCFDYIMRRYSVSFMEALQIINSDFNLNLSSAVELDYSRTIAKVQDYQPDLKTETRPTEIRVVVRPFNKIDKQYWKDKFDIGTDILKEYNVFPLKGFYVNDNYFSGENLCYGYFFGHYEDGREIWKIYQPFKTKVGKWWSNTNEEIYSGYDQLPWVGDTLVITKSHKDVMVLRKLNIPAISPQGESVFVKTEFLVSLQRRFRKIVLLYDNDGPGIRAADKLSKSLNIPSIFLPTDRAKDCAEFVERYSYKELEYYLKQYGISSNNTTMEQSFHQV